MAIKIPDGFSVGAGVPIDDRQQVATQAARDAIPSVVRWEGMEVYSVGDKVAYKLVGGITNDKWVALPDTASFATKEYADNTALVKALIFG